MTIMREGKDTDIKLATQLSAWLNDPDARMDLAEDYCRAYLTAEGKIKDKLPTKETRAKLDGLMEAFESEARRVQAFQEEYRAWNTAYYTNAICRGGRRLYLLPASQNCPRVSRL